MAVAAQVSLVEVTGDREPFVPLLEEADEPGPLRRYLQEGRLFDVRETSPEGERSVGVVLLLRDGASVEVKNLAVAGPDRGRGIGGAILRAVAQQAAAEGADEVIVGTADAAVGTIGFYLRNHFRIIGIRANFFDDYPDPVIENGIRARDMVLLRLDAPAAESTA